MPTIDSTAESERIVVSVIHKDPLVRAGVAAALSAEPNLVVRVDADAIGPDVGTALLETLSDVAVVVADYCKALALADLMRRPRSCPPSADPRVMIVSDRGGESEIRHALQQGIQGYLLLGCRLEEMAACVAALHRGQRYLGQEAARRIAESFGYEALTNREADVLRLVAAGCANKVVANRLDIALGTVKVHVKSILDKLGARTRTEAAAVAQRRGLLGHEDYPSTRMNPTLHTRGGHHGSVASVG